MTNNINSDYFDNVISLLDEEGFIIHWSKEPKVVKITIKNGKVETTTRIRDSASKAEVAEKLVTTMKYLS